MALTGAYRETYGGARTRALPGHLGNGCPAYMHVVGPADDTAQHPTWTDYHSSCAWCWSGAPHSIAAHAAQLDRRAHNA